GVWGSIAPARVHAQDCVTLDIHGVVYKNAIRIGSISNMNNIEAMTMKMYRMRKIPIGAKPNCT
ncbi:MAG: hypothetical protein MJE68_17395, partial [Proteobacteria bacterium]|nr:hypothetical protein [Pseudomonadota bacterium]